MIATCLAKLQGTCRDWRVQALGASGTESMPVVRESCQVRFHVADIDLDYKS